MIGALTAPARSDSQIQEQSPSIAPRWDALVSSRRCEHRHEMARQTSPGLACTTIHDQGSEAANAKVADASNQHTGAAQSTLFW